MEDPVIDAKEDNVIALVLMGKAQVLISRMGGAEDVADLARERGVELAAATLLKMANTVDNARQVVEAVGGVSATEQEITTFSRRDTKPANNTLKDNFMQAVWNYQPDDTAGFAAIVRDAQSLGVSRSALSDTFGVSVGGIGRWSTGTSIPTRTARPGIVERIGGMVASQKVSAPAP